MIDFVAFLGDIGDINAVSGHTAGTDLIDSVAFICAIGYISNEGLLNK